MGPPTKPVRFTFGLAALLLSGLGVYAVANRVVVGRSYEIAVRLAVAASTNQLVRPVVGRTLAAAMSGVTLGCIVAAASSSVPASMLYGASGRDVGGLVRVGVTALLVAALSASVPAWRATKTNAATALRDIDR